MTGGVKRASSRGEKNGNCFRNQFTQRAANRIARSLQFQWPLTKHNLRKSIPSPRLKKKNVMLGARQTLKNPPGQGLARTVFINCLFTKTILSHEKKI